MMKKQRILIVDDQPVIAGLVRVVLEQTGSYEIREEAHSWRALETVRAFRPDLIVLDIEMPGKNGAEVARDLWQDEDLSQTPIIFLSALVRKQEEGLRATAQGPMRFLAKPADPRQLVAAVGESLRSHEALLAAVSC
jgi:CheY-like chemotaxis protein